MKLFETSRSTVAALATAAGMVPLLASSHDVDPLKYSMWRGAIQDARLTKEVRATVAVITIDDETTVLGVLFDEQGLRVAFIDSEAERPLVSAAIIPTDSVGLIERWSDGICDHLELMRKNRRVPLAASAERILESLPENTAPVLRALADDPVLKLTVRQLADALPNEDGDSLEVELAGEMVDSPPPAFEEIKLIVVDRYVSSRGLAVRLDLAAHMNGPELHPVDLSGETDAPDSQSE